jgi:hypothetical protein
MYQDTVLNRGELVKLKNVKFFSQMSSVQNRKHKPKYGKSGGFGINYQIGMGHLSY